MMIIIITFIIYHYYDLHTYLLKFNINYAQTIEASERRSMYMSEIVMFLLPL